MKNILKCVAALSCISVICAVLLVFGSLYLPKQVRTFNWGEYLGDKTAQFTERKLSSIDKGLLEDKTSGAKLTAVYEATSGTAKGGFVVLSSASSQYGTLEMVVGISKKSEIVKVGYSSLSNNNGFYTTPLVQENYDKFVGRNPLEMTADDLISTSKATITKNVMLNAVRLSYKAGVALTGGAVEEPSPEVIFVSNYFTQKVTDAKLVLAASIPEDIADHVKIYEATLEGDVRAWVFVDTKVYHKFTAPTVGGPGKIPEEDITPNDGNGNFYLTETGIGVYLDGEQLKYGKLSSRGEVGLSNVSYIAASSDLLVGKNFGKGTIAAYQSSIEAERGTPDFGQINFAGATVSGVNFIKNLNGMVDYMGSYIAASIAPPAPDATARFSIAPETAEGGTD